MVTGQKNVFNCAANFLSGGEIIILAGFYQQQPAYRVATDLGVDYQTVTRVYQRMREAIYTSCKA